MRRNIEIEAKHTSIRSMFCLASLIFISASPLFENNFKILFSFLFVALLTHIRKYRFSFSLINLVILFFLLFILIFGGLVLDIFYEQEVDFISIGFGASIFIGFIISALESKENLLKANEQLMFFSLLIGIPIHFLIVFFPSLLNLAFTYNYGGYFHKTFFITNIHYAEEGVLSDRFVGIGREPGITQIFLLLALWTILKREKRFNFSVLLILIGILLGKSTAGFFSAILVLFLVMPIKKVLKYTLLFSPVIFIFIIDQWIYHTQNKLAGSSSFIYRYGRYLDFFSSDWSVILMGYGNAHYSSDIAKSGLGGWDTLLQLSQRYGILFFVLIVSLLFINNKRTIFVALILFISFLSQLIWFYPVVSFFYFQDRCNHSNKKVQFT